MFVLLFGANQFACLWSWGKIKQVCENSKCTRAWFEPSMMNHLKFNSATLLTRQQSREKGSSLQFKNKTNTFAKRYSL